ncbi:sushi, nidogen and EGF-like domain-containing protein 1 [Mizuhopecten yessoensis]|uniref:Alpha-tectorin n=1 Tax=Mizuhopecten yessoensis TaxID=6573 RepID=A0A210Q300_MIZYE|nr:sushi, nidogen and EGF-like domain-containing protein 1 [Mizuhopecten yessoensis]OWF43092.1 Alpha-tectorin [Mizuhopecten yessoensis]
MDVLVILTACLCGAVSLTVDDLYPYPHDNVTTADDELLYRNDDGSSPAIQISFSYFNNVQTSAYVNTNGDITFGSSLSRFIPYAFPYGTGDGNYVMIAAFWTDLITTSVGQIWYKLSTSSDLLTRAASDVQSAFSDQNDFNPSMVFIVTWHEVPYYGASGDALLLRNTFQIVLTADGTKSFVMLHYLRLDWARNAMVGFNAGDGLNGYTVNGSLSDDVVNLVNRSNVGVPGKFLFRVDGGTVQPADQTISSNNSKYNYKAVIENLQKCDYVVCLF